MPWHHVVKSNQSFKTGGRVREILRGERAGEVAGVADGVAAGVAAGVANGVFDRECARDVASRASRDRLAICLLNSAQERIAS